MMTTPTSSRVPAFTTRLDKHAINTDGNSVRHLVITATAPIAEHPASQARPPLNLGVVIDASGSMQGPPLNAAKRATCGVIDTLKDSDHLSIVSFGNHAYTDLESTRMDGRGKQTGLAAVIPIQTRGCTNMEEGWLSGCEHVASRLATAVGTERNQVLLLSDGHANRGQCDPAVLARHAHELRERGVATSTVGIGSGYSPTQLQAIAEAGGGRMHDAETPEEILEIIAAELDETLTTTVENLMVRLVLPAGVEAEVYGTAPAMRHGKGFEMVLGSMRSGATRDVVVKLTFPAGEVNESLLISGSATWQTPGQQDLQKCEIPPVEVVFASAANCRLQPIDPDTATVVAERWKQHIYRVGLTLNQDNNFDQAVDFAETQQQAFERYCRQVPGLEHLPRDLRYFGRSVHRRYDAISSKEVLLYAYKSGRGERDRRSNTRHSSEHYVRSMLADTDDDS